LAIRDYVVKRALQCFFTILVVLTINFFLFRILPGDPARLLIRDPRLTKEKIEEVHRAFGLDKPIWIQYLLYIFNTFQGNLGYSFVYKSPVTSILYDRFINTLLLAVPSLALAALIGVFIGVISAWKHGKKIDVISQVVSLALYAMPYFWSGMFLLLIFVSVMGTSFPISGMVTSGATYSNVLEYISDLARHMFLPVLTMTLGLLAQYTLVTRNAALEVITEDYILTEKAKGLPNRKILIRTVLRNSLIPVNTMVALTFGFLVAGSIEIETVFSWPGIGLLTYTALTKRDYPLLQGAFLVISLFVIFANFIADVMYAYLDPRIKY